MKKLKSIALSVLSSSMVAIGWALVIIIAGAVTKTTVNLFMWGWGFIEFLSW